MERKMEGISEPGRGETVIKIYRMNNIQFQKEKKVKKRFCGKPGLHGDLQAAWAIWHKCCFRGKQKRGRKGKQRKRGERENEQLCAQMNAHSSGSEPS